MLIVNSETVQETEIFFDRKRDNEEQGIYILNTYLATVPSQRVRSEFSAAIAWLLRLGALIGAVVRWGCPDC